MIDIELSNINLVEWRNTFFLVFNFQITLDHHCSNGQSGTRGLPSSPLPVRAGKVAVKRIQSFDQHKILHYTIDLKKLLTSYFFGKRN